MLVPVTNDGRHPLSNRQLQNHQQRQQQVLPTPVILAAQRPPTNSSSAPSPSQGPLGATRFVSAETHAAVRAERDATNMENRAKDAEINQLKLQEKALEENVRKLTEQNLDLQCQLSQQPGAALTQAVNLELMQLRDKNRTLEQEKGLLEAQVREKDAHIGRLQNAQRKTAQKDAKISALQRSLEGAQKGREDAEKEAQTLRVEKANLQTENSQFKEQIQRFEQRIGELQKAKEEAGKENQALCIDKTNLQAENAELQKCADKLREENRVLKGGVEPVRAAIEQVLEANIRLQNELEDSQKANETLRDDIQGLQQKVSGLQSDLEASGQRENELQTTNGGLLEGNSRLLSNLLGVQGDLIGANHKMEELQTQIDGLRAQLKSVDGELEGLQGAFEIAGTEWEKLESKCKSLETELKKSKEKIREQQAHILGVQEEFLELRGQVPEATDENGTQQTEEEFDESLNAQFRCWACEDTEKKNDELTVKNKMLEEKLVDQASLLKAEHAREMSEQFDKIEAQDLEINRLREELQNAETDRTELIQLRELVQNMKNGVDGRSQEIEAAVSLPPATSVPDQAERRLRQLSGDAGQSVGAPTTVLPVTLYGMDGDDEQRLHQRQQEEEATSCRWNIHVREEEDPIQRVLASEPHSFLHEGAIYFSETEMGDDSAFYSQNGTRQGSAYEDDSAEHPQPPEDGQEDGDEGEEEPEEETVGDFEPEDLVLREEENYSDDGEERDEDDEEGGEQEVPERRLPADENREKVIPNPVERETVTPEAEHSLHPAEPEMTVVPGRLLNVVITEQQRPIDSSFIDCGLDSPRSDDSGEQSADSGVNDCGQQIANALALAEGENQAMDVNPGDVPDQVEIQEQAHRISVDDERPQQQHLKRGNTRNAPPNVVLRLGGLLGALEQRLVNKTAAGGGNNENNSNNAQIPINEQQQLLEGEPERAVQQEPPNADVYEFVDDAPEVLPQQQPQSRGRATKKASNGTLARTAAASGNAEGGNRRGRKRGSTTASPGEDGPPRKRVARSGAGSGTRMFNFIPHQDPTELITSLSSQTPQQHHQSTVAAAATANGSGQHASEPPPPSAPIWRRGGAPVAPVVQSISSSLNRGDGAGGTVAVPPKRGGRAVVPAPRKRRANAAAAVAAIGAFPIGGGAGNGIDWASWWRSLTRREQIALFMGDRMYDKMSARQKTYNYKWVIRSVFGIGVQGKRQDQCKRRCQLKRLQQDPKGGRKRLRQRPLQRPLLSASLLNRAQSGRGGFLRESGTGGPPPPPQRTSSSSENARNDLLNHGNSDADLGDDNDEQNHRRLLQRLMEQPTSSSAAAAAYAALMPPPPQAPSGGGRQRRREDGGSQEGDEVRGPTPQLQSFRALSSQSSSASNGPQRRLIGEIIIIDEE